MTPDTVDVTYRRWLAVEAMKSLLPAAAHPSPPTIARLAFDMADAMILAEGENK